MDSNVFCKRLRLWNGQIVLHEPVNVQVDCFVYVTLDLVSGLTCCNATGKIGRVRRIIPICFFNHD